MGWIVLLDAGPLGKAARKRTPRAPGRNRIFALASARASVNDAR